LTVLDDGVSAVQVVADVVDGIKYDVFP